MRIGLQYLFMQRLGLGVDQSVVRTHAGVRVHRRGTWRRFDHHRLRPIGLRCGLQHLCVQRIELDKDGLCVHTPTNRSPALSVQREWTWERAHRRGLWAVDMRVGLQHLCVQRLGLHIDQPVMHGGPASATLPVHGCGTRQRAANRGLWRAGVRIGLQHLFVQRLGLGGDGSVVRDGRVRVQWHGHWQCSDNRGLWSVGVRVGLQHLLVQRLGLGVDQPVVRAHAGLPVHRRGARWIRGNRGMWAVDLRGELHDLCMQRFGLDPDQPVVRTLGQGWDGAAGVHQKFAESSRKCGPLALIRSIWYSCERYRT
jgi:hypothetical protein